MPDSLKKLEPINLQKLLAKVEPAVENVDRSLPEEQQIKKGVKENIRYSVKQLQDRINLYEEGKDFLVVGAVYNLTSGKVKVIE